MTDLRESLTAAVESVENAPEPVTQEPVESAPEKAERARDEAGRFAPKEAKPEPEEKPARAPLKRPQSWKKDYEPLWDRIDKGEALSPDELRNFAEYAANRESQYTEGVTTYKSEWDRAKPIVDAIAPYQEWMQRYNAQPAQVLPGLLNAHRVLLEGTPQQKQALLQQIIRDYRLDPSIETHPQAIDPNVNWMAQQLQTTQQTVAQMQKAWEAEQDARAAQVIAQCAANKEKYPHWDAAKPIMADLFTRGIVDDIDDAYNKAIRLDDGIWQSEVERQFQERQAKLAADKQAEVARAKSAAVSPKTSSPTGVVAKADGDLRSQLASAVDAVAGGRI